MAVLTGQQGLLFGLDARIALTIFAALAGIVGYVAFGRIDIAKEAALISELEAFENAFNNYQADMATFYPFTLIRSDPTDANPEDIEALWKADPIKPGFRVNWHGPYLHRLSRKHSAFGVYSISYATPDRRSACSTEAPCAAWLSLTLVPTKIWAAVNEYYDEAHGKQKEQQGQQGALGRVQSDGESGPTRTLYFRLAQRNPTE